MESLSAQSQSLAALVEQVGASTLGVLSPGRGGAWSAVVWREGVVVTAAHRFRRTPEKVSLVLRGGSSAEASLAGTDASTDLAVLRLPDPALPGAQIGDAGTVRAGHFVTAVGRSAEGDLIASHGIVNRAGAPWQTWLGGALDRLIRLDGGVYDNLAGAAVADASGAVIGIATPALSRSHGIVVPASTVSRVVDALLAKGHLARAFVGIAAQPVRLPGGESGLLVSALSDAGPAERAGVMVGDIVVAANGQRVSNLRALGAALAGEVGNAVRLSLRRGGAPHDVDLTVGEWPAAGRSRC